MVAKNARNAAGTKKTTKTAGGNGRPALGHEDDFARFAGRPRLGEHGWSMYAASKVMVVPLHEKHLRAGKRRSLKECLLALGVDDFWGSKYIVEVGSTVVYIIDPPGRRKLVFSIPKALQKRLREFDRHGVVNLVAAHYELHPYKKNTGKKKKSAASCVKVTSAGTGGGKLSVIRTKAKRRKKPTRVVIRGVIRR